MGLDAFFARHGKKVAITTAVLGSIAIGLAAMLYPVYNDHTDTDYVQTTLGLNITASVLLFAVAGGLLVYTNKDIVRNRGTLKLLMRITLSVAVAPMAYAAGVAVASNK